MNSHELLAKLVSFNTTSSLTNMPLVDFVARYLAQFGVEAVVLPNASGSKANLWASLGPKRSGGLLLSGHSDVVPVQGQIWHTPPFELIARNGRLYGRGSTDMKGFLACVLAAVPALLRAPLRCPIHLALTFDEEIGCFGAAQLVEQLGKSLPLPALAIVGEPSNMQAITAHKGLCAYDTVVTGHEVHSSLVHLGASSIRAASLIVQYLYTLADELSLGASSAGMQMPPYSTINVGTLRGGEARNIVAGQTTLQWEYRFIAQAPADWAYQQLSDYVSRRVLPQLQAQASQASIQTRLLAHVPAFEARADSPIVQWVSEFSGVSGTSKVPYGAEAGQYAAIDIDTVICGPGSI